MLVDRALRGRLRRGARVAVGRGGRHVRNYAVLYAAAAGLVVLTTVAPTVSPRAASSSGGPVGGGPGAGPGAAGGGTFAAAPSASAAASAGAAASGAGGLGTGSAAGGQAVPPGAIANAVDVTRIARGEAPGFGVTVAGVQCHPGVRQVSDIPYAPYCVPHYVGSNGGSTYRGVTASTIGLCFREFNDAGTQAGSAAAEGVSGESQQQVENTIDAYVKYFNDHYELYGRKIALIRHTGHGSYSDETTGGGQDNARADALDCQAQGGFAELGAGAESEVYVDALRNLSPPIMSVAGPNYDPTEWYDSEAPYAYDMGMDCNEVVDIEANFIGRNLGKGNARHAGDPTYQVTPRKFGLLVPDLPSYAHCGDLLQQYLSQRYGISIADRINYQLNLSTASQQTQNYVATFKSDNVTSLILLTDDFTPAFMTQNADKAQWYPEWLISGIANVDVDMIGRVYQKDQWAHALGPSILTVKAENKNTTDGRQAYVDEMGSASGYAYSAEGYFRAINTFANMVQMAGPDLTPQAMQAGIYHFPKSSGEYGTVYFGPHNDFLTHDMRLVYWSNTALGSDGVPGSYVQVDNGQRWTGADWPSGDPFP